jgi:hypothetical protein
VLPARVHTVPRVTLAAAAAAPPSRTAAAERAAEATATLAAVAAAPPSRTAAAERAAEAAAAVENAQARGAVQAAAALLALAAQSDLTGVLKLLSTTASAEVAASTESRVRQPTSKCPHRCQSWAGSNLCPATCATSLQRS